MTDRNPVTNRVLASIPQKDYHRLEAQLDGRIPPDWLQRFAELRLEYPEWSGHASDPTK